MPTDETIELRGKNGWTRKEDGKEHPLVIQLQPEIKIHTAVAVSLEISEPARVFRMVRRKITYVYEEQ